MTGPIYGSYAGNAYYPYGVPQRRHWSQNMPLPTVQQPHAVQEPKKEGGLWGAIKGIGKGIVNGAINTVKSLATPQGLLMAAGAIALTVATGGAAVPFLVGAGVAMGGAKMVTSAVKGDWEGVGEGLFTVGASALGARGMPKGFTNAATGVRYSMPNTVVNQGSLWARASGTARNFASVLRGRTPLTAADGSTMTLGQIARANAGHFWQTNPHVLSARNFAGNLRTNAGQYAGNLWNQGRQAFTNFRNAPGQTASAWYTNARQTAGNWWSQGTAYARQGADWARGQWNNFRNPSVDTNIARMTPDEFAANLRTARTRLQQQGMSADEIATFEAYAANRYYAATGQSMGSYTPIVQRTALPAPSGTQLATTNGTGITPFSTGVTPYTGGTATNPFRFDASTAAAIIGFEQPWADQFANGGMQQAHYA